MFSLTANSTNVFEYNRGVFNCQINGLVLSSLESDEEKFRYIKHIQETVLYDLTALWVAASVNSTDGKYYWNDNQAVGLLDPQPTVVDPNGHVAWFLNKNSSVPGYGDFRVVPTSGLGNPLVNAVLCGAPGLQFS
ncbi:hypothetical protein GCK72_007946 [Caenorhabditis remanei]|uniref:C-type lectin domain-containing protein n=1 Tax=Caenorhabditis remanei TaxID=31234 RepID=A0A6A5HKD1_CAERE|nr:hypothetical protein GCK72_007946 [Caenorhabditis remanei]KAF1767985.1 hypothetical protein GCK72_007946 [Caenorhabditis remanei]